MQKGEDPHELLTTEEILVEFKAAAKQWHWDSRVLSVICKAGTLVGRWDNSIKRYVFARWSIVRLIEHNNSLLEEQKINLN